MRCFLIVCEFHLDLVLELNLYLGNVIIDFSHLFLQTAVSRIGRNFGYNVNHFVSQTGDLEIESIHGRLDPLRMPCQYECQIGWLW